jgi:hypothetical protein
MSSPAAPRILVSLHFRAQLRRIFNIIAKFVALPAYVVGVVAFVVGVVAFVDTFAPREKCPATGLVLAQWPSSIASAIAHHETLTTGLIASAAGLCAVFIALRKFRLAEDRRRQSEQRREKLEKVGIQRVVEYYNRLLEPFNERSGTGDINTGDINYADCLNSLFTTGKFWHIYFGSVPVQYRPDARHVWKRLKALKGGMEGENESIREVVLDMRSYLDGAKKDLADREQT